MQLEPEPRSPRTHAEVVVRALLITFLAIAALILIELKTGLGWEQITQSVWVVVIVFLAAMLRAGARKEKSDRLWFMAALAVALAWGVKSVHWCVERIFRRGKTPRGDATTSAVAGQRDSSAGALGHREADPGAISTPLPAFAAATADPPVQPTAAQVLGVSGASEPLGGGSPADLPARTDALDPADERPEPGPPPVIIAASEYRWRSRDRDLPTDAP